MTPPKSLFLDVSDIIVWIKHGHEHYSGIQRVVVYTCVELVKATGARLFYRGGDDKFLVFECGDFERFKNCQLDEAWLSSREIQPKAHDRVLIMGASWSIGAHIETVSGYCRQNQLSFSHFVYDVSPLSVPQTHKQESTLVMRDWLSRLVPLVDQLFTISNFSKVEVESWISKLCQRHVDVVPVRIGDEILCRDQVPVESLLDKAFILNIGTIEARKNHIVLYQAYKILLRKYPKEQLPLLVLVGYDGWFSADVRKLLFEDPELAGLVVWLKEVTDPRLEWLYAHCQFSVYSSVYEGWGLPVAESLSRGKACLCSRIDVFKEISRDLLVFADPFSGEEWAREIEALGMNPALLAEREKAISKSYKTTPWSETAVHVMKGLGL